MSSWWRLWALEASWNRRSLQTAGWWTALEPWLRARGWDRGRRHATLRRHGDAANTNPVLAGLALGVLMRLEEDGDPASGTTVQALSRALGSQGDGLVWTALRPLAGLLAATIGLWISPVAAFGVGLVYLLTQARLRRWGLDAGYRAGREVLDLLQRLRFPARTGQLRAAAVVVAGGLAGGLLAHAEAGPLPLGGALAVGVVVATRRWDGTRILGVWAILLWAATRLGG